MKTHITAAQKLIHFHELDELQNSLFSQGHQFIPMAKEGVQIHYITNHWVTSASIGGNIPINDSCYSGKLSTDLSHQLALLYKLKSSFGGNRTPVLPVNIPSFPQQEDSEDCGVFAIAYAYHAARNDDINTIFFNQDLIRKLLKKCFAKARCPHSHMTNTGQSLFTSRKDSN